MSKRMLLTSIFAIVMATPAFADRTHTYGDGQFPDFSNNEYLEPDAMYENAATSENLQGVTGNGDTLYAISQWANDDYTIPAGYYSPASYDPWDNGNNIDPVFPLCEADYYCPGTGNTTLEFQDYTQGRYSCSDATNSDYNYSAPGATSINACYKPCDSNTSAASNLGAVASGGIAGFDYYGAGTDICWATACQTGHHLAGGLNEEIGNMAVFFAATDDAGDRVQNSSQYIANTYTPDANSIALQYQEMTEAPSENNPDGTFAYKKILVGHVGCSQSEYNMTAEPGSYCFVKIEGVYDLNTNGAPIKYQPLQGTWFYYTQNSVSLTNCESECSRMAGTELSSPGYEYANAAMLSSLGTDAYMGATCTANVIDINWGLESQEYVDSLAAQCTYGGNIYTPTAAPSRHGKKFLGWIFSNTAPVAESEIRDDPMEEEP